MGERLNFICVCGRLLRTDEYRAAFQGIFTSLGDFAITPVEVRRMGGEASEETTVPWADSAPLFAHLDAPSTIPPQGFSGFAPSLGLDKAQGKHLVCSMRGVVFNRVQSAGKKDR